MTRTGPVGFRSLTSKVIAVVTGAVVVAALFFTVSNYLQAKNREYAPLLDRLRLAAYNAVESIRHDFEILAIDATGLADLPPVQRIVSDANARFDTGEPYTPGTLPRSPRLEAYLKAVAAQRPSYTQMRVLTRGGDWQEILRIDITDDGPVLIPADQLQRKGHRDYLQPLKRDADAAPYFSDVSVNIDYGVSDGVITIRYVRPIRDDRGVLLGAVVVNADYESLIRHALPEAARKYEISVITDALDIMRLNVAREEQEMILHTDPEWVEPPHADLVRMGIDTELSGVRKGMVFSIVPTVAKGEGATFGINVLAQIPQAALMADANAVLWRNLLNGGTMSLLATLMAWALGRRLMDPLRRLTAAIQARHDWLQPLDYSVGGHDEVSVLARSFADVTDELVRLSARARSVVDSAADGIVTIDPAGTIEEVNAALCDIFGYTREELLGQPLTILMPPEAARFHQSWVEGSKTNSVGTIMAPDRDIHGIHKDGHLVPLGVSISFAHYADRVHYIGVVRDVTEEREAERQREAMIDALRRSNEELDQFAYVASHDLKAPLRVIDNASRWLEEDLADHLDDDTRESMDLLRNRVQRMERLLDDLLRHSRIGRVALPDEQVSGDELVRGVSELLPQRDGIRVQFEAGFDAITVDRMPLQTVLLNLVSNAIRHHDKPEGAVRIGVTDRGACLEFTVADDGPGIDPRYHEKIFGMFQTLKSRDELDTSGMGLAMVRKQLDLVGGEIAVQSDGQTGTTFRLTWPKQGIETGKQVAA